MTHLFNSISCIDYEDLNYIQYKDFIFSLIL